MPQFTYIGDEPFVYIFGLSFSKGEAVEVTDGHALRKLANHPHFMSVVPLPVLPETAPEIGAALTPSPADVVAEPPKPRKRTRKGNPDVQ